MVSLGCEGEARRWDGCSRSWVHERWVRTVLMDDWTEVGPGRDGKSVRYTYDVRRRDADDRWSFCNNFLVEFFMCGQISLVG